MQPFGGTTEAQSWCHGIIYVCINAVNTRCCGIVDKCETANLGGICVNLDILVDVIESRRVEADAANTTGLEANFESV